MASSKKDTPKEDKKGYQPKATARHAKITKTREEEIDSLKKRIETDKHLAKKYESGRKAEIKALPRSERAAAKADLKESIKKRKEAEQRDKEKLRVLMTEEKTEKVRTDKEIFDDDEWVKGGRKKKKGSEEPAAQPEAEIAAEPSEPKPEEKEVPPSK